MATQRGDPRPKRYREVGRGNYTSILREKVESQLTGKIVCLGLSSRYKTRIAFSALAGIAQWIERRPANQRLAGLIPSHGTDLGCSPGPQ